MKAHLLSRRRLLTAVLAGSVVVLTAGCDSLPKMASSDQTDGSELALRVHQALRNSPFTSHLILKVTSQDDEVTIVGVVPDKADIDAVERVANQVDGVRHANMQVYERT